MRPALGQWDDVVDGGGSWVWDRVIRVQPPPAYLTGPRVPLVDLTAVYWFHECLPLGGTAPVLSVGAATPSRAVPSGHLIKDRERRTAAAARTRDEHTARRSRDLRWFS